VNKTFCTVGFLISLCLAPLHAQITLTSLSRQTQVNTGADDGQGFQIDHPIGLTQTSSNAGPFNSLLSQQASVSNAFASSLASQVSLVLLADSTLTVTGILTTSGSVQVSSSPGAGFVQLLSDLEIHFHLDADANYTLQANTLDAGSASFNHYNYVLISSNSAPSFGYLNGSYPPSGTISGTFPRGDQYIKTSLADSEAASPPYFPPVSMSQSRTQFLSFTFTVTPNLPRLSINRSGTNVVLSWSAVYSNFVLETKAPLSPALAWNPAPGPVATIGTNLVVTNRTTASSAYYRLRKTGP